MPPPRSSSGTVISPAIPVGTTKYSSDNELSSTRLPPPGSAAVIAPTPPSETKCRNTGWVASPATGTVVVATTSSPFPPIIILSPFHSPPVGVTVTRVTTPLGTLGLPTPSSTGVHDMAPEVAYIYNPITTSIATVGTVMGPPPPICVSKRSPLYHH